MGVPLIRSLELKLSFIRSIIVGVESLNYDHHHYFWTAT
jgi:hypothetical protein